MSNKTDTGGFVYPCTMFEQLKQTSEEAAAGAPTWADVSYPGITRRDWLAGLAMQGVIGKDLEFQRLLIKANPEKQLHDLTAKCAYNLADAMIQQGRKGE